MKLYVIVINDVGIDEGESSATVYDKKAFVSKQEALNALELISAEELKNAKQNISESAFLEQNSDCTERTLYFDDSLGQYTHYEVQEIEV